MDGLLTVLNTATDRSEVDFHWLVKSVAVIPLGVLVHHVPVHVLVVCITAAVLLQFLFSQCPVPDIEPQHMTNGETVVVVSADSKGDPRLSEVDVISPIVWFHFFTFEHL